VAKIAEIEAGRTAMLGSLGVISKSKNTGYVASAEKLIWEMQQDIKKLES